MLFSSPPFFVFFVVYFALHLLLPARWRLSLIILGSTFFYSYWNPYYVWLPYALTLVAYGGTLWTENALAAASKKWRFATTIVVLFIPLVVFKYTNFIFHSRLVDWSLPLGISFVTFTLVAYVVDVWRKQYPAEKQLLRLVGCVFFFPHLIAGPIVRPSQLIPQLAHPGKAKLGGRFAFGLALFAVGLFKKLVLADPLAAVVDQCYASQAALTGWEYLLALWGFTAQIYCDFSGYTDMGLGAAHLLGVRLPQNFARPYTAVSLIDFWQRWHISLSSWLRDYLYIPLGGNRKGAAKQQRNLLITMGLGGLWHGANWTFVIWGLYHGLGLAALHTARRWKWLPTVPKPLSVVCTLVFVAVGWAFFRAPSASKAWEMLRGPFVSQWPLPGAFLEANAFALVLLGFFFVSHRFDSHSRIRLFVRRVPRAVLWLVILVLFALSITVSAGSSSQFIYFEF